MRGQLPKTYFNLIEYTYNYVNLTVLTKQAQPNYYLLLLGQLPVTNFILIGNKSFPET